MADVSGALFIIILFSSLVLSGVKIVNIIRLAEKKEEKLYNFTYSLLLFAVYLILWLLMLNIFLGDYDTLVYISWFRIMSFGIMLHFLFLVIEMFYSIAEKATEKAILPYNPSKP